MTNAHAYISVRDETVRRNVIRSLRPDLATMADVLKTGKVLASKVKVADLPLLYCCLTPPQALSVAQRDRRPGARTALREVWPGWERKMRYDTFPSGKAKSSVWELGGRVTLLEKISHVFSKAAQKACTDRDIMWVEDMFSGSMDIDGMDDTTKKRLGDLLISYVWGALGAKPQEHVFVNVVREKYWKALTGHVTYNLFFNPDARGILFGARLTVREVQDVFSGKTLTLDQEPPDTGRVGTMALQFLVGAPIPYSRAHYYYSTNDPHEALDLLDLTQCPEARKHFLKGTLCKINSLTAFERAAEMFPDEPSLFELLEKKTYIAWLSQASETELSFWAQHAPLNNVENLVAVLQHDRKEQVTKALLDFSPHLVSYGAKRPGTFFGNFLLSEMGKELKGCQVSWNLFFELAKTHEGTVAFMVKLLKASRQ